VNVRARVQGQRTALQDVVHLDINQPRTSAVLHRVEAEYVDSLQFYLLPVYSSASLLDVLGCCMLVFGLRHYCVVVKWLSASRWCSKWRLTLASAGLC